MTFKGAIAEAQSSTGALAATVDALHWESAGQWHSLPWHEIARATWSSESTEFVVFPVVGERLEWNLTEAGRLPEAARERITATIVAQEQIKAPGIGTVVLIFRQVQGQIVAQTVPPVDLSLVAPQIAQVKAELGLG